MSAKTRLIINIDTQIYEALVAEASARKAKDDAQRVVRQASVARPLSRVQWAQSASGQRIIWQLQATHGVDIAAYNKALDEAYSEHRRQFVRPVGRPASDGPPARRLYTYIQDLINERLLEAERQTAERQATEHQSAEVA